MNFNFQLNLFLLLLFFFSESLVESTEEYFEELKLELHPDENQINKKSKRLQII